MAKIPIRSPLEEIHVRTCGIGQNEISFPIISFHFVQEMIEKANFSDERTHTVSARNEISFSIISFHFVQEIIEKANFSDFDGFIC